MQIQLSIRPDALCVILALNFERGEKVCLASWMPLDEAECILGDAQPVGSPRHGAEAAHMMLEAWR